MADFRIDTFTGNDPHTALIRVLHELMLHPGQEAIIRVADEDAANEMHSIIEEAVDRIRIEFDSSEMGPNPLWTPSKLKIHKGRVELIGSYDQTVHTKGFEAK